MSLRRHCRQNPLPRRRRGLAAPLALPAGFGALLVVGASAAASDGAVSPGWVLALAAVIVTAGAAIAETAVAPVLAVIGWLTVVGFSRAPYAHLRPTGQLAGEAAATIAACTVIGLLTGVVVRRIAGSFTLWIVEISGRPDDGAAELHGAAELQARLSCRRGEHRARRSADLIWRDARRRRASGTGARGAAASAGRRLPLLTLALSAPGPAPGPRR